MKHILVNIRVGKRFKYFYFDVGLDCCFVEDNAVVVKDTAVINFLGAESRRKEVHGVENALKQVLSNMVILYQVMLSRLFIDTYYSKHSTYAHY
jgi:hypothetical protein